MRRRSAARSCQQRAFSLLEVMVAVAIVAMVGVLIYGAFLGMSRSRTNMVQVADRHQQGRQAIDRMARELGAAFISAHEPLTQMQYSRKTAFVGHDQASSDRVDFTAFANLRLARDSHESDQAEISYFATRDPDTGNLDLVRRLSRYIDDDPTKGGLVQVLAENISGFELKYMDSITGEWGETWDSTQPTAQLGRLPSQVWITLWMADGPGGAPIKFETKATLAIQLPLNFAIR